MSGGCRWTMTCYLMVGLQLRWIHPYGDNRQVLYIGKKIIIRHATDSNSTSEVNYL